MATARRVLLSTTSSLDGWEVSEYLGPVSAQFVIGTGLFTDILSSWTDFFGAHSGAYQQKLDRIHQEALDQIAERARRLGATVVLGLRVDHDEISGGGKSMLMVSASGTAARARPLNRAAGDVVAASEGLLTGNDMKLRIRLKRAIELASAGRLMWSDEDTWRLVIENPVKELTEAFVNDVEKILTRHDPSEVKDITQKFEEYFLTLPRDAGLPILYDCLGRHEQLFRMALTLIKQIDGFDARLVLGRVLAENRVVASRAIALVEAEPLAYDEGDAELLTELAAAIEKRFRPADYFETAGLFGSKQVWKCVCGKELEWGAAYCTNCGLDRWGLAPNSLRPEAALQILQAKIEILRGEIPSPSAP